MKPYSYLFLLLLLFSCTDKTVETQLKDETQNDNNPIVDSLFGVLDEEKQYFQHFILEFPAAFQNNLDSLINWVALKQPGGIHFKDWDVDSITVFRNKLEKLDIIQPFIEVSYFDYLNISPYAYWLSSEKNKDQNLNKVFEEDRISFIHFEDIKKTDTFYNWLNNWENKKKHEFIVANYSDSHFNEQYSRFLKSVRRSDHHLNLELNYLDTVDLNAVKSIYNYQGLFFVKSKPQKINQLINNGADIIRVDASHFNLKDIPYAQWNKSNFDKEKFIKSTKKILSYKRTFEDTLKLKSPEELKLFTAQNLIHNSHTLLRDKNRLIPLSPGYKILGSSQLSIDVKIRQGDRIRFEDFNFKNTIPALEKKRGKLVVFIPDTLSLDNVEQLNKLTNRNEIVFCISNVKHINALDSVGTLVYQRIDSINGGDQTNFIQALSGHMTFNGNLPLSNSLMEGMKTTKKKLARTTPIFCGISADSLNNIDKSVRAAINGRAFPGCQVLVAKDGNIIYDKNFGHHTYQRTKNVTGESIYDVASLTKVVATTMIGMRLYEEGLFKLNDSLYQYLPDSLDDCLKRPSTLRNITFQELFTHTSGLPSGFPVLPYMQYTNEEVGRYDKFYCDKQDSLYTIPVAENLFLDEEYKDSIWLKLHELWIDPSKTYRYSDVNMNVLYEMFKHIIRSNNRVLNVDLNDLTDEDLFEFVLKRDVYDRLEMRNTGYNPLIRTAKEQIVPTENERFWRKQLLQGYVHDPNAALLGGVAGNAGIFSTTNDLAILGEMLLNGGVYNDERILNKSTIDLFTSSQANSWRGLGFNKPSFTSTAYGCADSAPPETYGHTGFTGTCIWMDPINHLTYVFLSNRVHPSVNNRIYQYAIRSAIHQIVYDAELL